MSTKMLRSSVDKILLKVKSFRKRSGRGSGSDYESLIDGGKRSGHSELPDDIPKRCLAVYVGTERFVIPTKYLSYQLFKELLKRSEEEFGYEHMGGLEIACEPAFFEHLVRFLETNSPAAASTHLQERLDDFYAV